VSATRAVCGFLAGFLAVLIFHQIALLVLHLAGVVPATPWNMAPVPPLGVPAVVSAAFWGGVWGIVLAWLEPRSGEGAGPWLFGLLFGAVAPTLVAWFVVRPLKGLPVGAVFAWPGIIVGPIVNGAWGLGTVLLLRLPLLPAGRAEGRPGGSRA
jgi:hypothetical protein